MRRSFYATGMLMAVCLAGCSSLDQASEVLVAPGKYDFYSCQQLAAESKAAAVREKELRELIEKAVRGTSGPIISAAAYDTEYLTTYGELRQLRETAERKRCESQWQSDGLIR